MDLKEIFVAAFIDEMAEMEKEAGAGKKAIIAAALLSALAGGTEIATGAGRKAFGKAKTALTSRLDQSTGKGDDGAPTTDAAPKAAPPAKSAKELTEDFMRGKRKAQLQRVEDSAKRQNAARGTMMDAMKARRQGQIRAANEAKVTAAKARIRSHIPWGH